MTGTEILQGIVRANRDGIPRGIYSVCTAHPLVLEAALVQGKLDGGPVLIEATANQVNQFGGYTGMTPADFRPFVEGIANEVGFPLERLILGGDHLGPVCWCDEPAEQAMAKARDLIAACVAAGFKKIHLDTSMACAGDPQALDDAAVAARAAELCEVAERSAREHFGHSDLLYVVGTEVPVPGGATEAIEGLQVTPPEAARETVAAHEAAFTARGLQDAWSRVVGLVVQPGVEFDHTSVHDYVPGAAARLSAVITELPNLVFEAHSTDYQDSASYPAMVRDHFAILKVGPQLTYALREALFALSHIEEQLLAVQDCSRLREVCEEVMLTEPGHWQKYYPAAEPAGQLYRRYSYSDRIRYYWPHPRIRAAVEKLLENLEAQALPLPLLQQYLPREYALIRAGSLAPRPRDLLRSHIMQVAATYSAACGQSEGGVE